MIDYPPVNQMNQDQRIEIVKDIFSTVTNKYDFLNRFLSFKDITCIYYKRCGFSNRLNF